jgi:hypothetical protein
MQLFELNLESIRRGWAGSNECWFSTKDYKLHSVEELVLLDKDEEEDKLKYVLSLGYIPYFTVSNEEVIKNFVQSIKNNKLKDALSKIDKDNYVESFWKYFNIYPELSDGLAKFEDDYVLEKASQWCENNNINYVTAL